MKIFVTTIGFLFCSLVLFGQYEVDWEMHIESSSVRDMLLTSEGDYLVCGYLDRVDFGSHFSETDVYAALVSEEGTIIWERTFGGSCQDWARYCIEIEDGFIIAGQSCSDDGDLTVNNGGEDLWIIKLSADGELLWQKTVGETTLDSVVDMVKTQDSGFAVLGKSLQKAFTEDDCLLYTSPSPRDRG